MNLRRVVLPVVLAVAALVDAGGLHAASLPDAVAAALAQAGIPEGGAALYVYDLGADREVLALNPDQPMNPASVMKLLTTFAALDLLGPAYRWKTEAWLDGSLEGGRLHGNLVLKGYGDPKLDLESFWLFLRDLRSRGLREIDGDVLLDRSYFALDAHDPALFDNEPSRPYNTGADALLVNDKTFRLQFLPDDAAGRVTIFSEPALPQVLVVNALTLGPGDCNAWPDKPALRDNVMVFSGVFPSGCGEKFRHFSLLSADEYLQTLFRQLWIGLDGRWDGRAREGNLPTGASLFSTWESAPLGDIIREVNKFSINVKAREIFLTLGAGDNPPATVEKSRAALTAWLERKGLSFPELSVENGAGLSRSDRISARHLAQLLVDAWHSPLMPEYVASLSLPGVDGTMKRRLAGSPAGGQSHVKTGYIEGVRALAGYAHDARGNSLVAVLLVNQPNSRDTQGAQDALLEWIRSRDSP